MKGTLRYCRAGYRLKQEEHMDRLTRLYGRSQKVGTSLSSFPEGKCIDNSSINRPKSMLLLSGVHYKLNPKS